MINVFQPSLGADELEAVADVFASNWLGHGPRTKKFEAEFAAHLGVDPEQVLFLNSGTSGLFLAAELLDLGPADDVVLPSVSFVSAANAIAATGARPVFCDVDEHTLNPTLDDVVAAITPRTKAVVLLHYGGYPGEIATIAKWCRANGITLIEDAACAVASSVDGQAVGTFGDLAMWSFDAMKVLVTGDGGMLYVRDPEVMRRARRMAYHGLEQSSGFSKARVSHRWWELQVVEHGRRLIGNDLTAAIGSVQLRRLPEFVARRKAVADLYDELLAGVPGVRVPPRLPHGHAGSYYFYWVQLDREVRDKVAADLLEKGIYTTLRYPPLHKVPAFRAEHTIVPRTEILAETTLLLPIHQAITADQARMIADELTASLDRHTAVAAV